MASSSGTTSASSQLLNSGSEGDLRAAERRHRRMLSNRESARRSRMRKQKHLDDLKAQVGQLRRDNSQICTSLNLATQHCLSVDAENSVLRTQMTELNNRLQSLNEILRYMSVGAAIGFGGYDGAADELMRPWGSQLLRHHQPILASDMFQYC